MFDKIIPVYGDITTKRLGLNDEHYQRVIGSANIVFHMAASLKLEATLKPNVEMNLTGTKHVIDVCKQMPNLIAAIHLSTAFCNCDQEILKEEVYEWSQKPMDLIKCAEWMSEEAMDVMGKKLIAPHPNTYTYTKRLSELLVRDEYPNLPICIVRPSIGEIKNKIYINFLGIFIKMKFKAWFNIKFSFCGISFRSENWNLLRNDW